MRIGIITQPLHTNYGGLLQNYALQQALIRLGHEPITLNQTAFEPIGWRVPIANLKTFLIHCLSKDNTRTYSWQRRLIRRNTDLFINKYITHTGILKTYQDFHECTKKEAIDILIVGSDQVWRPMYNREILRSFLDFSEGMDVKRLAYAASFGVDCWEFTAEQTFRCRELIKQFDGISVREDSAINLCREYLDCEAVHVLDPTMLLDKEDYTALVYNEHEPENKGNLFTYILDDSFEKQRVIQQVSELLGLTPFSSMPLPLNRQHAKNIDRCIFPPVTKWLRAFMDAKFVVCDSFHGVVFSIIFNKPFLVIGNKERGMTRFKSLLNTFRLQNRMMSDINSFQSIVQSPIEWEKVNSIRTELKVNSIDFLRKNISNSEKYPQK